MRGLLAANEYEPEPEYTPGLTVTPHVTDRHAPSDVGGRIDTTKQWRPSIPDPVNSGGAYNSALMQQSETDTQADDAAEVSLADNAGAVLGKNGLRSLPIGMPIVS